MEYRLDLPADARIHPVIHVSQLKRHVAPEIEVHSDLAEVSIDHEQVVFPIQFVDSRMIARGSTSVN